MRRGKLCVEIKCENINAKIVNFDLDFASFSKRQNKGNVSDKKGEQDLDVQKS